MSSHQFTPKVGAMLFATFGVTLRSPFAIRESIDSEMPVIRAMSAIFNPLLSARFLMFTNVSPFLDLPSGQVFRQKNSTFLLLWAGVFAFALALVLDYLCRILFSRRPSISTLM
jgi:hypothetical protein